MEGPVIYTQAGAVRGERVDAVQRFLGVPYAAPPVGLRRFLKPEPVPPWTGVREATRQGACAPQRIRPFPALDLAPLIGAGWNRGDDYLNANVWTPERAATGLPVMVFIHGGAFVLGSNLAPVIDGAAFARSGVVLISINYRLGIDGFLPMVGAPTNLGLRDQIAALRWVRDNARAFGGDPDNVTVFGESAGAMSIANLLTSPPAKGLFRRAIIESGHGSMVRSIAIAERLTRKLARMLGVPADADGFRQAEIERCVATIDKAQLPTTRIDLRDASGFEPAYGLSRFLPVVGDDVLPRAPLAALADGVGSEVEVLIGTNAEEMNLYFVPTGIKRWLPGLLARYALSRVQPNSREFLKAYGLGKRGRRAGEVYTDTLNDLVFRLPARRFAAAHRGRTHFYEFGWRSPALNGELGACHAIEIPFVFNTLASCSGPRGFVGSNPPQGLADSVQAVWVGFARNGALRWPEYDPDGRQVYALEDSRARRDPVMPAEGVIA